MVSAATVLGITAAVLWGGVLPPEAVLSDVLVGWASPRVRAAAEVANLAGTWRFLLPATLVLMAAVREARRRWWLWAALLIVSPLATEAWQEVVGRPRPHGSALGFPSGHATAAATFAVVVFYLAGRAYIGRGSRLALQAGGLVIALAVGLGRVVLGRHWPGDVVVGFALGSACAAAGAWWDAAHPPPLRDERGTPAP